MPSTRPCLCVVAGLAALPAAASDWRPLTGAEIAAALAGQTIVYDPDEQTFFDTGRTRYRLLKDRWGWWEVRDDTYCSLWPPAEEWACHGVEAAADGRIRFTDPDGIVTEGRPAE